jgi:hypothetical protein
VDATENKNVESAMIDSNSELELCRDFLGVKTKISHKKTSQKPIKIPATKSQLGGADLQSIAQSRRHAPCRLLAGVYR